MTTVQDRPMTTGEKRAWRAQLYRELRLKKKNKPYPKPRRG